MQNLVVQALAMRQLGKLNSRHLLAAGYGLRQAEWCPRTIHTRQLWGCSAFPAPGCHRIAFHGRDPVRSWSVNHLRFKSSKKKGTARTAKEKEEEEEEEEKDEAEKDAVDSEDESDEDPNQPKDYKDIEKYVQSFRYDTMLSSVLDIGRSKLEDAFYHNQLRLNGMRLIKKSKTVKVGDILDLVLSENKEENTVTLMRIIIRRVSGETSRTEKHKVAIRRWKYIVLPRDEAFKG